MYFNWSEFVLWEHEVAGSSPVIPIIKIKKVSKKRITSFGTSLCASSTTLVYNLLTKKSCQFVNVLIFIINFFKK